MAAVWYLRLQARTCLVAFCSLCLLSLSAVCCSPLIVLLGPISLTLFLSLRTSLSWKLLPIPFRWLLGFSLVGFEFLGWLVSTPHRCRMSRQMHWMQSSHLLQGRIGPLLEVYCMGVGWGVEWRMRSMVFFSILAKSSPSVFPMCLRYRYCGLPLRCTSTRGMLFGITIPLRSKNHLAFLSCPFCHFYWSRVVDCILSRSRFLPVTC